MGLIFDKNVYEEKSVTVNGEILVFRAYEGIPYVESPQSELQVINIYIPEKSPYKEGKMPIFLPNTVGGYMPGKADTPKVWEDGTPNSLVQALLRGYMVAAPGLRGRGMKNEKGENIGVAPADICDYKAAVRYLRYNKEHIPGDTEKIISNGTSAGGAMSALLGTTGNHPDYEPYLDAIGAAKERDDIFYASCYCPIINLEHADAAYEWADKAQHIRIRHGAIDRDTSVFIPLLFAVLLQNNGVSVDLAYPWGKWHMGDYDLEKVFDEVDSMEA